MKNIRKGKKWSYLIPLAILAISTSSIFIRFAQNSVPSLAIAAYRLLFASLFMLPFSLKETFLSLKKITAANVLLLVLSGILLASHFVFWIVSLGFTSVIISVVFVTTTPIWVSMASPLITKDKISQRFWGGLVVAGAGMLIVGGIFNMRGSYINSKAFFSVMAGSALALMGALCAAGYVIIGRLLRKVLTNRVYTFSVYSIGSLTLLLLIFILSGVSLEVAIADLKWLLLLALVPQLIGHSLINWYLGSQPAHKVSIFLLGEPIGSTLLAVLFLGEYPTGQEIVGALIILTGIVFAISGGKHIEKQLN